MSLVQAGKVYYVDSAKRLVGTDSTFTFQFNQSSLSQDFDRVLLLQISIPKSYYSVQVGYNIFQFQEGAGTIKTLTIPPGNYNVLSFGVVVSALLTTNSQNSYTYTITYPNQFSQADTGLLTYTASSYASGFTKFIFNSGNFINELFGFPNGSTQTFSLVSGVSTLVSTVVVKFIPEDTLYLHSSLVQGDDDILQEIYDNNSPNFSVITYQNVMDEAYSKQISSSKNNTYTFSLTDENGIILNLNGQNMQMALLFFKKETINRLLKNYLKYILSTSTEMNSNQHLITAINNLNDSVLNLKQNAPQQPESLQIVGTTGDNSSIISQPAQQNTELAKELNKNTSEIAPTFPPPEQQQDKSLDFNNLRNPDIII